MLLGGAVAIEILSLVSNIVVMDRECSTEAATIGTSLHSKLDYIRNFRDKYLMRTKLGRTLVSFYYMYSPFLAELIKRDKRLKNVIRIGLVPK